jgi:hypothetical protein
MNKTMVGAGKLLVSALVLGMTADRVSAAEKLTPVVEMGKEG